MDLDIITVILILGGAIILFASERIRVDLVALMVLMSLILTGTLTASQAFTGFSSPAVITVWAIYIVSAALTRTGVADFIGQRIMSVAGRNEASLVAVIMITVGTMSAFMNNIGATAVLLPAVVRISNAFKIAASKLLIPLAFGSLLGGVTTLIGTPPNLLASDALVQAGMDGFNLLDFTPMGLIILVSSIIYMVLIGRHLLPSHPQQEGTGLTHEYGLRNYLTELHVLPESSLIGHTIVDTKLGESYDLTVMGLIRNGRVRLGIMPNAHVAAGDILLVEGQVDNILRLAKPLGVTLLPDQHISGADLVSDETLLAEAIVGQQAPFAGKTLKESRFRSEYGVTVLAIWREGAPIIGRLTDVPLRLGDILLVHGRPERVAALGNERGFVLLAPMQIETRRLNKAPISLVIFASMISLVLVGHLHISAAAVLGAVLSVLTGCLTMEEAYQAINWESVFLIAGMLPLGLAMEQTGTALFLSEQIIEIIGGFGNSGVMIGLFLLTTGLTAFMSNAAAAVLVAPIAISTALSQGVDPRAFVMGIAIAASNSFVTPIAHQACILVYGPGNYRFFDYARVGLPLTVLIWILMIIFLPSIWPL